jgi:acetyltransferase-like isoleucine patch superfamily enzyme/coenzyme F420-reducing hydrogenase beta subunit
MSEVSSLDSSSMNIILKSVVYHKIVERRMDSAGGGALGALLETFMKDEGYYCAPVYDENHHLEHILTDNPDRITDIQDYYITLSRCTHLFTEIISLLNDGKRVLFVGQACQCMGLKKALGKEYENLLTVEMFCTGFSEDALMDKYIEESEKKYGEKVSGVRFRNKEFSYKNSKRMSLANGRTVYIYDKEPFDTLHESKVFLKEVCKICPLKEIEGRYSDISLGLYGEAYQMGDNLGYSSVYVHSEKGKNLFDLALRRLEPYREGVDFKDILNARFVMRSKVVATDILDKHSLSECAKMLNLEPSGRIQKLKHFYRLYLKVKEVTRLRPGALWKFVKLNFFRENTLTDYKNMGYIFVAPYSEFSLAKNAVIELHGPLYMGTAKRVPSSHLETRLWMRNNSRLIVRKSCVFGYGGDVEIFKDAVLDIGDLSTTNPFTIICGERIELGTPVYFAKDSVMRDTNSHLISTSGFKLNRPITIGNHVWIASNCAIMPGSKIEDGCIVGSVSYLNKKVPAFSIVEGHPAEVKSSVKYFKM